LRLITGIVKKLKLLQNPKKWYIFFLYRNTKLKREQHFVLHHLIL
jgi:hypothetical protein